MAQQNDTSDFIKRNAIRKQQTEFAATQWTRTVGDRVQLTRDYFEHLAWESGVIIHLGMEFWNTGVTSVKALTTTIRMDNGDELEDNFSDTPYGTSMPIVPHEDYFKDDGSPTSAELVE